MSSPLNLPEVPLLPRSRVVGHLAGLVLGLLAGLLSLHLLVGSARGIAWTPSAQRIHSWVQKKHNLAAATEPPRLLLVGGSNVFYGLRAERLSRELGLPVVNLATHGALPAGYLFHELLDQVKPGDRVLYCPEYVHYFQGPNALNDETITYLIAHGQDYLRSLPAPEYAEMLLTLPADHLLARWFQDRTFLERRMARIHAEYEDIISDHGDYSKNRIADLGPRQEQLRNALVPLQLGVTTRDVTVPGPKISPFLDRVVELRDQLRERGATLLFSWPNTIESPDHHTPGVEAFFRDLTAYLEAAEVPVVGDPFSAMAPREEFFDTVYHLTAEGAEKRSARLAPALKARLEGLAPQPASRP